MRVKRSTDAISRSRRIVLFLSLFILSFFLWGLLAFTARFAAKESEQTTTSSTKDETRQHVDDNNNQRDVVPRIPLSKESEAGHQRAQENEDDANGKKGTSSRFLFAPEGYSPALVVMTSTNGAVRTDERNQVLEALCAGNQNADALRINRFKLYLSIDALSDPRPLSVPSSCIADLEITQLHQPTNSGENPTQRIASHYKFALKHLFKDHSHVVVLEDDLVPAHDFVSLFVPGSPAFSALEADPRRVWCVSAWNDAGDKSAATDVNRLFRTDFFPGLGWMTTQGIWEESIKRKWSSYPATGWDNWLRSNNDEERDCIVPEVNRVKHISTHGTNVQDPGNSKYAIYSFPSARTEPTQWFLEGGDSEQIYLRTLRIRLFKARRVNLYLDPNDQSLTQMAGDVLVVYERSHYASVLSRLGLRLPMLEPRAGKEGVIPIRKSGSEFYFLCDLVLCAARLFPEERLVEPSARVLRAPKGVSCTSVCNELGLRCNDLNLQTVAYPPGRACVLMRTHFDCELGCSHEVGTEIPAMVVDKKEKTVGQCLTAISAVPTCDSAHPSTRRLCSCV